MKELFNKIIQTSTALLISLIVVYGIVYAQQVCCSTIVDACLTTSNRISGGCTIGNSCRTSSSHYRNNSLQSNLRSINYLADFGAGNTCCETDCRDSNKQAMYFSRSFTQDFYPLQKIQSSFNVNCGAQTNFKPKSLPISLKAVPIYILTQSIIC